MRKIKMKTICAGPCGVRHKNSEHTLSKEEAAVLVRTGHAEYADGQMPETADARPVYQKPKPPKGGK